MNESIQNSIFSFSSESSSLLATTPPPHHKWIGLVFWKATSGQEAGWKISIDGDLVCSEGLTWTDSLGSQERHQRSQTSLQDPITESPASTAVIEHLLFAKRCSWHSGSVSNLECWGDVIVTNEVCSWIRVRRRRQTVKAKMKMEK